MSSNFATSGNAWPIASRRAKSSALTGPLPSPVTTYRTPSARSLTVASETASSPGRVSVMTRQDSTSKYDGRAPSTSSASSSSNDASAASKVNPCASISLTRPVTRVTSSRSPERS